MQVKIETNFDDVMRDYLEQPLLATRALRSALRATKKPLLNVTMSEILKRRKFKRSELYNKANPNKGFIDFDDKTSKRKIEDMSLGMNLANRSPSLLRFVRGKKTPENQKGIKVGQRKRLTIEVIPGRRERPKRTFIVKGKNNNYIVARPGRNAAYNQKQRQGRTQKPIWGQRSGANFWLEFQKPDFKNTVTLRATSTLHSEYNRHFQKLIEKAAAKSHLLRPVA